MRLVDTSRRPTTVIILIESVVTVMTYSHASQK